VRSVAALLALVALVACGGRAPDVGAFDPILREDNHVVELLTEVDQLAERDPDAAARDLRETILPRARANREAVAHVAVTHPRAQELLRELTHVTTERVATVDGYASALASHDVEALHNVIRRQVTLDQDMDHLEGEIDQARRAPPDRGCASR
jgi:hypothetical protein